MSLLAMKLASYAIVAHYPKVVAAGSVVLVASGMAEGVMATVAENHEIASQLVITAILSGVGGIISIVTGAWLSIAKIRSEERQKADDRHQRDLEYKAAQHQRDLEFKMASAQSEMDRKERMHDFAGKLNVQAVEIENLKRLVAERDERIAETTRTIEVNRAWINSFIERHPHESGEMPVIPPPGPESLNS